MIIRQAIAIVLIALISNKVTAQAYQYYFGNIHAHSSYSDGNKDSGSNGCKLPGDSYTFARQSYNFNFLGISEHNHSEAGMDLANYKKGLYQADTANKNGEFVSMYGMEYGVISNGGHVVIYGIDSLIGWEPNNYNIYAPKSDYHTLWRIISSKPSAFATLAHPETSDYNNLVTAPYSDTADVAISGTAIRSGGAFSTTIDYSDDQPATTYTGYFRRMLAAGYKLGPTLDHDNHYTTFGRTAQSRTVVLAQTLHRDSIMAAYKAMRFYASDDWNTLVNFTINAYPLGSTINTTVNPTINISVSDPDENDTITSIKIYYGIAGSGALSMVLTSVTNKNDLSYVHNIKSGKDYYYYAEITQADGHNMWTAPIWVTKNATVLPLNNITLKAKTHPEFIELTGWLSNKNYKLIELEKSFTGNDFTTIEKVENNQEYQVHFIDRNPCFGYQYYRSKCTSISGEISYSSIVSVHNYDKRLTLQKLYPNPVENTANIIINSTDNTKASISIYNALGKLEKSFTQAVFKGKNTIQADISSLLPGAYILVVSNGATKAETSFIKK